MADVGLIFVMADCVPVIAEDSRRDMRLHLHVGNHRYTIRHHKYQYHVSHARIFNSH